MISSHHRRGLLFALLSAMAFTSVSLVMKYTKNIIPAPFMIVFRNFVVLLLLFPFGARKKMTSLHSKEISFYVVRSVLVYVGMYAMYYAYRNLSFPVATTLSYTEPMMHVVIAGLFLQEKIRGSFWLSIALGWIGAALVTFQKGEWHLPFTKAVLYILLGCLCISIAKAMMKVFTRKQSPYQVMWYSTFFNLIISIFMVVVQLYSQTIEFPTQMPSGRILLLLPLSAFCSFLGLYGYTKAISYTTFHSVSLVSYTKLLFAIPLGILLFDERLSWVATLGALLIVGTNLFQAKQANTQKESR